MRQIKQIGRSYLEKWIAIDCSSASLTVALLEQERCIAQIQESADRNHSVILLPKIEQILTSHGIHAQDLGAIAVGVGPGSYTGVRIGVAVAKTMAMAVSCGIVGISSLAALALGTSRHLSTAARESRHSTPMWVVPMMNARRGQVFTGLYQIEGHQVKMLIPDQIRLWDTWMMEIQSLYLQQQETTSSVSQLHVVASAEDYSILSELIEQHTLQTASHIESGLHSHAIEAYDVGLLAYPLLLAGQVDHVHTIVPNYTQLPEAEVKWKEKMLKGEDQVGH